MTSFVPARARPPRPPTPRSGLRWGDKRSPRQVAGGFVALAVLALALSLVADLRIATGFLTAVGFAAALLGFWRPLYGLYGVGILCTIDPMTRVFLADGGLFRWNSLNYLLLGVAVFHGPFLLGFRNGQVRLLQALACLFVAGLMLSRDLPRGEYDLLAFGSVFGLVIYFLRGTMADEAWSGLGLVTGSLSALMGLVFFKATVLSFDPNAWVAVPVCGLFGISLGFAKTDDRRFKMALGLLALVNTCWAFLSGSRGGLLTSFCALLFLLLMVKGLHRRALVAGGGLLVVLAISSEFGDLQANAIHRINKLLDPTETMEHRTSRRSDLVFGGLYLFTQQPILGVGTGGFVPAWQELSATAEMRDYDAASGKIAHSGWIKVLVENGIFGGALFGAFVLSFALVGWRTTARDLRLVGLFTTAALTMLFLTQEFQSKAQWFLAAGAIVMLQGGSSRPAGRRGARWPGRPGQMRGARRLRPRDVAGHP